MRPAWIGLAALVAGCAADADGRWAAVNLAELKIGKQYPEASAVVLLRERKVDIFTDGIEENWYRQRTHERRLILSEAGFKYAEVKITRHKEERIEVLRARIISPDGQVEEVDAQRILTVEHKSEKDAWRNQVEHRFRFPNVKVGSVLEWVVLTQRFSVLAYLDEEIAGELPVRRYALEMLFRPHVKYALKAYNVDAKFNTERRGDITRISFEQRDVPAVVDEDNAPPRAWREPRLVYRAQAFDWGSGLRPYYLNWPSTVKHVAVKLLLENKKLLQGAALAAPEGCGVDRRCAVERSLEWVRKHAALSEFVSDEDDIHPLKEVLAAGAANNYEKAYLLWHLLGKAGVQARLALVARPNNGLIDPEFPLPTPFNHLIVQVPAQPGIGAPLWLDPSCEYCAAGQIPPWSAGCDALVMTARERASDDPEVKAEFVKVSGNPALADAALRASKARVDGDGNLEVELSEEWHGDEAVARHIGTKKWLAKDWNEDAERVARARAATARVRESERDRCDRAQGVCRRVVRFTVPSYATLEEGRLLVPLTLFSSSLDDSFVKAKRKHGLDFRTGFRVEETATLQLPEGWSVEELPAGERAKSTAVDSEFSAARDGSQVVARRSIEGRSGRFPTAQYGEIRSAVRAFASARGKTVILRKQSQSAR